MNPYKASQQLKSFRGCLFSWDKKPETQTFILEEKVSCSPSGFPTFVEVARSKAPWGGGGVHSALFGMVV